ncbi:protocadherin-18-like isoform X2 [Ciona intestinalis]
MVAYRALAPWVVTVIVMSSCCIMTSYASSTTVRKSVHLREDSNQGTIVEEVADVLNMRISRNRRQNFQQLSQKLISSNPNPSPEELVSWLSLDRVTGRVTLARRLDREEICVDSVVCSIRMQIYVHTSFRMVYLDVVIIDVNEHVPEFPSRYILVNVSEDARPGDVISLDKYQAMDRDAGNNSVLTYTLSQSNEFRLGQYFDETGSQHLHIEVVKQLDYEKKQLYRLTLTARDHGEPALANHVPLQIRVTDVNDNEPLFDRKEYSVVVREDAAPGYVVSRVHAVDHDEGRYGLVRYFIAGRNEGRMNGLFDIDHETGEVTLKKPLDREASNKLIVFIEARDQDVLAPKVGRCRLVIHVSDVNDNQPIVSVSYIANHVGDTVYISESSPLKTFFAYVSAKDNDLESNGEVELMIETFIPTTRDDVGDDVTGDVIKSPDPYSSFVLNDDGMLGVGRALDRETQPRYIIQVTACDLGVNPLCTNQDIEVILLDENDHTPHFKHDIYNISMMEDTVVGTVVTTITATDGDKSNLPAMRLNHENQIVASTNGDVIYSVSGGDGSFSIDPKSGRIMLVRALDREQVSKWKIFVTARDRGEPMTSSSHCTLIVTVDDVNDNAPVFTNPSNDETTIYATILRDDVITRIQAVDYDEQSDLKYRLLSEDGVQQNKDINSTFVINSQTGDLRLNMSHEDLKSTLGLHTVTIEARDSGIPMLRSLRQLNVMVTERAQLPKYVTNPHSDVGMGSSSLVIIIAALSAAMLVLIVVVIVIVVRCKRDTKTVRTYVAKDVNHDDVTGATYPDVTAATYHDVTDRKLNLVVTTDVERSTWGKSHARRPSTNYDTVSDVTSVSHNVITTSSQYQPTTTSGSIYEKKPTSVTSQTTSQSHHDVDSGRGDSDQDVCVSDVTFERGYVTNTQPRDHVNRCDEQCLLYGHSDACWMPVNEQDMTPDYPNTSSPYDKPSYPPTNLPPIPEKSPIQSYWSHSGSGSNLSSIYSTKPSYPRDEYARHLTTSFRINSSTDSNTTGYVTEHDVL